MPGQYQRSNADEQDERAERHGILVRVQDFPASRTLIQQPLSNEDAVVVPHAKNKCCEDDIDDIELQARHAHDALDPVPAHRQRQEGKDAQFQAAKTHPQEDENDERAYQADGVEVLRQGLYKSLCNRCFRRKIHRLEVASVLRLPVLVQRVPERLEGMRCEARLEAFFLQCVQGIPVSLPEGIPSGDGGLLRCPVKAGHDAPVPPDSIGGPGPEALQNGKTLRLLLRHIIDVVQVGVEPYFPALPNQ